MAVYFYKSWSTKKHPIYGMISAVNEESAYKQLQENNMYVSELIQLPQLLEDVINKKSDFSVNYWIFFCRQLAFALGSGINIVTSMSYLYKNEKKEKRWNQFVSQLIEEMQRGKLLTQAISQSNCRIPIMLLEFILIGEQQGKLAENFMQGAIFYEREKKMKDALKSALIYPALVCGALFFAMLVMICFVIPIMADSYARLEIELPGFTKGIIYISAHLKMWWFGYLLLFGLFAISGLSAYYWLQSKEIWKAKCFKILHQCMHQEQIYFKFIISFSRALGQLLNSGVPLLKAIQVIQESYKKSIFSMDINQLYAATLSGKKISESIEKYFYYFPTMAKEMLKVGDDSGSLGEMLLIISDFYQKELEQWIERSTKMIEPLLILVLGLIILLLASSVFLPIVYSYQYI